MTAPCPGNLPGIAVIGSGNWGMNHVRVWYELGCLRVVCDTTPARLALVTKAYPDVESTWDLEAALSRSDVTGVVVATPAATHAHVALRALDAGKDVLVEKPIAMSVAEAEKMAEAAAERNAVLMVSHILEYHPAVLRLRELVESGMLGRIRYAYSNRLNFGRVRTEESALWSFAPHDLALLMRLFGGEPREAACTGGAYISAGIPDVTTMHLSFPNDVRAHVFVSWLHPFKEHRLVVVGDQGMAVLDDTAPWSERLVRYPHRIDWVGGRVPVARRAEAIRERLERREPLQAACEHFLDRMVDRRPPLTNADTGLAVLRVLEAAERSLASSGAWQPVASRPTAHPSIHPTATVDPKAMLGEGTRVWHYSHVMDGARIGQNCVLGQNVFIAARARIGDEVRIQNNVSVFEGVVLDDQVFCGPSVVFTNVINPRAAVDRRAEFLPTYVRTGATLGANSTIICGVTIGRYAMVGAGAVVTRDVPDFGLVVGVPARLAGWMCVCGERLGKTERVVACASCDRSYQVVDGTLVEDHVEV